MSIEKESVLYNENDHFSIIQNQWLVGIGHWLLYSFFFFQVLALFGSVIAKFIPFSETSIVSSINFIIIFSIILGLLFALKSARLYGYWVIETSGIMKYTPNGMKLIKFLAYKEIERIEIYFGSRSKKGNMGVFIFKRGQKRKYGNICLDYDSKTIRKILQVANQNGVLYSVLWKTGTNNQLKILKEDLKQIELPLD